MDGPTGIQNIWSKKLNKAGRKSIKHEGKLLVAFIMTGSLKELEFESTLGKMSPLRKLSTQISSLVTHTSNQNGPAQALAHASGSENVRSASTSFG